jgi:hypothetical protein
VKEGVIQLITNQSGHYRPAEEFHQQGVMHIFKGLGAKLDANADQLVTTG